MNWVLTNAQIELIASDVSLVDYNYGKKDKKRNKGEFDNTKADVREVREAGEKWLERYGDQEGAGQNLAIGDILGGGFKQSVGIKL